MFTEQKSLKNINFNTDRVLRWRLILEENGPDIKYITDFKNMVAYALSGLPNNRNQETTYDSTYTTESLPELYKIDEVPEDAFNI